MKKLIFLLALFLYGADFSNYFPSLVKDYKDAQTKHNVQQFFNRDFSLYPYHEIYLLPVTWDFDKKSGRKQFETKFQISIMKSFANNLLGKNEVYFFAYTQTSWWQTSSESAPFRENNYQPEIFVLFPTEGFYKKLDAVILSLDHQSNGMGGVYSRSWNRIYAKFILHYKPIIVNFRVWYRLPPSGKDDNPDIEDYLGYGDIKLFYPYKNDLVTSLIRYNPATNKGAIEIDYSKKIKDKNVFLYFQYFYGYAESLIDYNRLVNKVGIGFEYSR